MTSERPDGRFLLTGLLLMVALALVSCTTDPGWVDRRVTVCVADMATGQAICQERLCRFHTGTGEYDCLNRPVVG